MNISTAPTLEEALDEIMQLDHSQFTQQNNIELETLLDYCLGEIGENTDKLLTTLFIKALKNQVGPIGKDEHIYLKKFEVPQIKLFDLIIKHFPFVRLGQEVVNTLIVDSMVNNNNATVIDVGIGRGVQTIALMEEIEKRKDFHIEELTIMGIEPFTEALSVAEKSIREKSAELNLKINFIGINSFAENLSADDLIKRLPNPYADIFINSSLTLHHIQSSSQRNKFLAEMARLRPKAFILTEPNSNHLEPNFYRRFKNSYNHFLHLFKVIDELPVSRKNKNALKLFFGREIEDIIGKNDHNRFERHEKAVNWILRLENAGFTINKHFPYPVIKNNSSIQVKHFDEGFLGFTYKEETILSIIYANLK
ncbi:MAG: GRAS family protein [Bacteroidota bacterium]